MNKKKSENYGFLPTLLGDEKRQSYTIPLFAIFLSVIAGSIVILLTGKNPLKAYISLLQGSGLVPKPSYAGGTGQITDFTSFLDILAPMIFAALAVIIALKSGLFNIGVSGQMLISGFIATILVGYSPLNAVIAKPLVLIIGITVGALTGGFIGFLKYKFNINEVVSCIMLNNIIQFVTSYFINSYYVNPVSRQSEYINKASSLTIKGINIGGVKADFPISIILAILASLFIYKLLESTTLGYEIKAVGSNKNAAAYAGIKVGKTLIVTMMISGALAGLAGVSYYLGYFASMQPRVISSLGFDAIATALLANNNAIGAIFSSILITILSKGSVYMSSKVGVVKEISGVITSLILLFSATGAYIRYRVNRKVEMQKTEKMTTVEKRSGEDE